MEEKMKKFFTFLCILIIFIGIIDHPSSDAVPGNSKSSFTSTTVTTSDEDSAPIDNNTSLFSQPSELILIGFGLVGIAVIVRKTFKK